MFNVGTLGRILISICVLWFSASPDAKGRSSEVVPAQEAAAAETHPLTTPALDYINRGLPDWLRLSGALRLRFESRKGLAYAPGNDDDYALVRTRLNVEIQPTQWLRFFVQGQDSRAPNLRQTAPQQVFRDPADLRQAYVGIGSTDSGAVSLTVGRQLLGFGDQRLIGPLEWTNTARSWEAVRLALRPHADLQLDLFSASVVAVDPSRQINQPIDGVNLHGIYGSLGVIPESNVEGFLLWRTATGVTGETGLPGNLDRYSAGVRIAGDDVNDFDYSLTYVNQWGSLASDEIRAWAYSLRLGHTFDTRTRPRVLIEYNFASGDDRPGDGKTGWFDDVYPTAHPFYGQLDLVGWRNIKNVRVGATLQLLPPLQANVDYHAFWLASRRDSLYNTAGIATVAPPPGGARSSRVGDEIDLTVSMPLTDTISVGGGVGRMFPGPFLEENSPGGSNTFAYVFSDTRF